MSNNLKKLRPPFIVCVCHGQTEQVFLEELAREYFALKLKEEGISDNKDYQEAPRLISFDDELNIQTNEIENKLTIKFEKGDFYNKIASNDEEFKNSKLWFVVLMDIKEKGMDPIEEQKLIETNAKEILCKVLSKVKIIDDNSFDNSKLFCGSKFIYFVNSIEKHFDDLSQSSNKKPQRMRKLMRNNDWNSTKEIKENFSEEKFELEKSNISEIFDFLDEVFKKLIEYLES